MKNTWIILILLLIMSIGCSTPEKKVYLLPAGSEEASFALEKLSVSLKELSTELVSDEDHADYVIRVSIDSDALDPGGYLIKLEENTIHILGGDRAGVLYGVMEYMESLKNGMEPEDISGRSESPYLPFRAIKFNLPWDSYRRSDALQLHMQTCRDTLFWQSFLDMMVENRFNVLTLWNLHPFDWMVKLEKYPEASGLTDDQFEEWKLFWTSLFRMARERGIETYIVNWNIFVADAFAEAHELAEYSTGDAYYGVSDTSELVRDYNRECIREVVNQYPDLTGIGFSLGEAMENMTPEEREKWCLDVIVKGMEMADRKAKLIHRVPFSANLASGGSTDRSVEQMTRGAIEQLEVPSPVWVEIKFNWSHPFSTPKLIKVHGGKITDVYWNPLPENYRIAWMMRNEDFFALRWAQTEFIREHIKLNVHPYVGGYFIGSECYIPAEDYFTKVEQVNWKYAFERQWLFYKTWGRLLYNPETDDALFIKSLDEKYGNGETLFEAWNAAGRIPLMIASFWDVAWDFTLYTEGLMAFNDETRQTEFISVDRLIRHPTLDTALINIDSYTTYISRNNDIPEGFIAPDEFAGDLNNQANLALNYINNLNADNIAFRYELADIQIWANLGLYFSRKIQGGIALSMFNKTGEEAYKQKAIERLEEAVGIWENIVQITTPLYREMPLVHLNQRADKYFHWSKLMEDVRKDVEIARNAITQ